MGLFGNENKTIFQNKTFLTIVQGIILYQLAYILMDEWKKRRELPPIRTVFYRMWPFHRRRRADDVNVTTKVVLPPTLSSPAPGPTGM